MNSDDRPVFRTGAPAVAGRLACIVLSALFLLAATAIPAAAAASADRPPALAPAELSRLLKGGEATALNVMSRLECVDDRIPGSLCTGAGDPAAQLARLVPDRARLLVLYCGSGPCAGATAYLEAARAGGYAKVSVLEGGLAGWKAAGLPTESPGRIPRRPRPAVSAAALKAWLGQGRSLTILDIRPPGAFREGHIEGAVNIPMEELHERYAEIPLGRQLVVTDEGGDRSFLAASYLIRKGIDAVRLAGGMKQWRALPSEGPKAPANR